MSLYNQHKIEPICLEGWAARSGDGSENLFNTSHSGSPNSFYGEKGIPGVDELIDLAGTNFDPKVRREAIEKAEELTHNYVAFAFNYVPVKVYGTRKNVKWAPRADESMCITNEDDK